MIPQDEADEVDQLLLDLCNVSDHLNRLRLALKAKKRLLQILKSVRTDEVDRYTDHMTDDSWDTYLNYAHKRKKQIEDGDA